MPRALVTGASGFVGPFLIRHLLREGYEVVGGVYGPAKPLPEGCHSVSLDVTHRNSIRRAVVETAPHEVYHLAGITRPASGAVELHYQVNFSGAFNLLEALYEKAPEARVLLVGSAYAYGRVDRPIIESDPF